jgi:hypothetical protein
MFVHARLTHRRADREAAQLRQSVGVFRGLNCYSSQREDVQNGTYGRLAMSPHGSTDTVGYGKHQPNDGKAFEQCRSESED